MGVRSDPVGEKITADLVKLTAHVPLAGTVAAQRAERLCALSAKLNDSYRAVNLLLDKGVAVRRVARGDGFTPGDFIVSGGSPRCSLRSRSRPASTSPRSAARRQGAYEIRKPRIAMYQRYGGGNMDEGWTRLMFEQFNVPFKSIMDAEIKTGGARGELRRDRAARRFDAGHDGRAPAGGGAGGRAAAAAVGGGPDNTPPEYRSGFGAEGVKALQAFVEKGGTLVTFGQAGDLPIQRFGLPLRNIVAGLPAQGVLVARIDAARALRQHEPDRVRHAGRRASRCSWPAARSTK